MDNRKVKAQVTLEFAVAVTALMLLLGLTVKIFVWMGTDMVDRHAAFEGARSVKYTEGATPVPWTYPSQPLDLKKQVMP